MIDKIIIYYKMHFFVLVIKTLQWYTGIKSFTFLWGTQCILGQKVCTKSWMAAHLSPLREHCYYLVLSSNVLVKGDKVNRENNLIRLPLETWCSLSVPKCIASNKGNWNSWCLYWSSFSWYVQQMLLSWSWPAKFIVFIPRK